MSASNLDPENRKKRKACVDAGDGTGADSASMDNSLLTFKGVSCIFLHHDCLFVKSKYLIIG